MSDYKKITAHFTREGGYFPFLENLSEYRHAITSLHGRFSQPPCPLIAFGSFDLLASISHCAA